MPQVQVLPSVPTFGRELAGALGQLGLGAAQFGMQRAQKTKIQNLQEDIADPSKSPIQKIGSITKLAQALGPEQAKALIPLYLKFLKPTPQQRQIGEPNAPPSALPPHQPGIPTGQMEPITAATTPIGVQESPAPTGQTEDEIEARKAELRAESGLPYGIGEEAQEELKDIRAMQKIQAQEKQAITAHERKVEEKEQDKIDVFQKDIVQGLETALISEANLNRMEALIEKGDLMSPLGAYLTDLLEVPVSLVSSEDTEEFQKLVSQRGLKVASAYGFGRILATEFEQFLKTIPNLLNTKGGKERIIGTLRYFDNLAKTRYEIYKEELGKRKTGERSRELELRVAERMRPEYAKFGDILKHGSVYEELPDAAKYKGEEVYDEETGQRLRSDGKEWQVIE